MLEMVLPQQEADALLACEKQRKFDNIVNFPPPGGRLEIPLVSSEDGEEFILDLSRGSIAIGKVKYQNRARKVFVLARVCHSS